MPQKVIKFKGINRNINEFQTSGECEELINLRPIAGGGNRVVKSKKIQREDFQNQQFFEHSWGNYSNIIEVSDGIVIWTNRKYTPQTLTDEFYGEEVFLSAAGNTLVVYCEKLQEQKVFRFNDSRYRKYDISTNLIKDISVEYSEDTSSYSTTYESDSLGQVQEAINRTVSGFHYNYPNGLCGRAVIGCTYELDDGNEIWATGFIAAEAGGVGVTTNTNTVNASGCNNVSVVIDFNGDDTSFVKKINIYSSRPVLPFEAYEYTDSDDQKQYRTRRVSQDVGLMYYQGSIDPSDATGKLLLRFDSTLVAEKIMDINSGAISRVGYNIPYNNRFHYYKSNVYFHIQPPTLSLPYDDTYAKFISYVLLDDKWILTNKIIGYDLSGRAPGGGDNDVYLTTSSDFIYPMAGVKKLAFVKANFENDVITVPYEEMFFVELKDSSSYNYSYAFDVKPELVSVDESWLYEITENGQLWSEVQENGFTEKMLWKKETNAINVSAQYNPLVFPVEYSYAFSGEIIDVATAYLPVSQVQYGQYPVTVFTTNGIFAMELGDGSVLYSKIVPLQPYVIEGKAAATPYGTFFISFGRLYLLSGRESINLSTVLDGKRELRLKEVDAYQRLYCDEDGEFYDFEPHISKVDFKDYISGASLFYDQLHNELYICNLGDYQYSYVFNLDSKSFYKSTKKYVYNQVGATKFAMEIDGEKRNIVYVDSEVEGVRPIFLQSRPMSFEALSTHIQRLILLTDAELSGERNLSISVFASDNLHDWRCIISAQKQDVILRHIRTNKAARSYKDYVIIISGTVSTDTDISDLIADYTVVQRRLG